MADPCRTTRAAKSDGLRRAHAPHYGSLDLVSTARLPFQYRLLRRFSKPPRKSGHKKPGLNKKFDRDHAVPGLFSELFNVAASRPAQMTTERIKSSRAPAFRQGKPLVNGRPNRPRPTYVKVCFAFCYRLS